MKSTEVLVHGGQPQGAEPFAEAGLQQALFAFGQMNARPPVHEVAEFPELCSGKVHPPGSFALSAARQTSVKGFQCVSLQSTYHGIRPFAFPQEPSRSNAP
jgi:hypothetical protein